MPQLEDLTPRDQFAMAALAGGLGQGVRDDFDLVYMRTATELAERAYAIADAMLVERQRPPKTRTRAAAGARP